MTTSSCSPPRSSPQNCIRVFHCFNGTIPVAGGMQAAVEAALVAILKQRAIDATVTSIGGNGALNYSIVTPRVLVGTVTLQGVNFAADPSLAAIRKRAAGSEFIDPFSATGLRENVQDAYRDLGYVDVAVTPITTGTPIIAPDRITVDLTGSAQPGPLYTVSHVTPSARPPASPQPFSSRPSSSSKAAPASRVLVLSSVARSDQDFITHGYLEAHTTVDPQKDSSAHTVAYTFQTSPGPLYQMRSLSAPSFSEQQKSDLAHAWQLKSGDVMDGSRIEAFERSDAAKKACGQAPIQVLLKPDRAAHMADVELACKPAQR